MTAHPSIGYSKEDDEPSRNYSVGEIGSLKGVLI
jgi:hypothetical protein